MDESHKDAAPAPPSSDRRLADLVGLDRFGAFSDGVYAIAITLLVLELTVPEGPEPLGRALVEQWPEFLGYFISFAFIGGSWLTHARMTRLMRHADSAAAGLDLLILILIALLPFTTSLSGHAPWRRRGRPGSPHLRLERSPCSGRAQPVARLSRPLPLAAGGRCR